MKALRALACQASQRSLVPHRCLSSVSRFSHTRFTSNSQLLNSKLNFSSFSNLQYVEPQVPKTIPPPKSFMGSTLLGRIVKGTYFAIMVGSTTIFVLLCGFFIYDATTYAPEPFPENVKVSQLALSPEKGGPDNLPILKRNLDDYDSPEKEQLQYRPKLVVLGSGWGAVGVLKSLSYGDYDVTVISPTNYFLFTPLLPSAATGTLEVKTLIESIRNIVTRLNGHYLEAQADKVEFSEKLVKVHQFDKESGKTSEFYVPYDKLVVAVGSNSNTHGVEGLEHCFQLKTAADAVAIKKKISCLLETACLPTTSDEERRRLLSFVVCGGGPTGVEFAAEVFDLLNEDLPKAFPKLLRQELSVHVIQSRSNILNTYDERISEYATQRFKKDDIDVLTNSRVVKILPNEVIFNQKDADGKTELKSLPFGFCLWSTGVAQNPLAKSIVASLPYSQHNKRAIETDSHLRVIGAPLGDVYAIGDCSTVRTDLAEHTVELVRKYIIDKHLTHVKSTDIITDSDIMNMKLNYSEIYDLGHELSRRYPEASEALNVLNEIVPEYDCDSTGHLTFTQISSLLKDIDTRVTSLPATAQRAAQQGKYLGKKLAKLARSSLTLNANDIFDGDMDAAVHKPFCYKHLGSLAYIGNSAVFDLPGYSFVGGLIAMYLWRGTYFAQSVSLRTRVLLFLDWLKRGLFGRDFISY